MKHRATSKRRRTTKSVLRLLDLEHTKSAVLSSLSSLDAQRGYRHAIDEFVDWYCSEPRLAFNRTVVLRYRSHLESRPLAPGTVNLRLGAVRRLAYEAADCGLLIADLAAGIRHVKGVKKLGVRLGNWLTAEQGQTLWQGAKLAMPMPLAASFTTIISASSRLLKAAKRLGKCCRQFTKWLTEHC